MSRVTLHDVAVEAGVSDSTVSRALRGLDKVDGRTRARVQDAARRLRFSFARNASSLASGKTMRVSIVFANALNTWFDSSVLQGAYDVLVRNKYDVVPNTVRTHEQLNTFFERLPADGNVDAIIVTSINLGQVESEILGQLTIPTVGLDSGNLTGFDASVLLDDKRAMREAVGLLKQLGHRRIAFVEQPAPGDFHFTSQLRADDFMEAAHQQGFVGEDAQRFDMGKFSDYYTQDVAVSSAAARLLAAEARPTAICVESDDFAISLVAELRHFGIRIPEEMSVIGFDDTNVASAVNLTTIHQNPIEMSRDAATKALILMRGEHLQEPHSLMTPALVLRGTTARAPQQ